MKPTNLFRESLANVPNDIDIQVALSFDIADRIADVLKERGMTQKDLAQKMGKKESEISRYLSGTHNFKLSTLAKISDVLGCRLVRVEKQNN